MRRSTAGIGLLVVAGFIWATFQAIAGEPESSSLGKLVIPQSLKPLNAEQCVEPVELMRRDHMKFLYKQRDETVKYGVRGTKYSLTGCIDCHAATPAGGEEIRAGDSEYFCTGCHEYTSVKIDCFECHSDRPQTDVPPIGGDTAGLPKLASNLAESQIRRRVHNQLLQQVELRGK